MPSHTFPRFVRLLAAAALGAGLAQPAFAQEAYPQKPVELIVPFSAGAATDLGARVLARALEGAWKVPVRVVNKPGGNTVPAVNEVMNAKPDGTTILVDGPSQSAILDTAEPDLPFKVMDRTFIGIVATTPLAFFVAADSPYKTLADLVSDLKAQPTSFTWTSLGGATAPDQLFRELARSAGIDVARTRAVQLKGGNEAVTMVAGGHVKLGLGTISAISPALKGGKVRALAVASAKPWPSLPDIPTTAAAGFPGVEVLFWLGFSGPPGLPASIVSTWDGTLRKVLAEDEVRRELQNVSLEPTFEDAAQTRARIETDRAEIRALFAN
ncbi:Bug family tripartite tricarboxylate transporter substrate binding protein [Aquabacter cavernae]|uniref:Bug family tripartite tricarboxylate transporter substrate binding protein n=1 Tax=Aquabacter cavernae TaxID=2496029 RepID=UPI000F8F4F97|nr:tripartite tricarboxylate transporter substrate binding protein [Aquabacter cavernae]